MIELLFAAIPLEQFDQQKLESLMRRIPSALVKTEDQGGKFERKFYSFPKMDDKGFKIKCQADHYLGSPLPSASSCTLHMLKDADVRYDEHAVEFNDTHVVTSIYNAIHSQSVTKKFYSNERVYGLGVNGKYGENFRFTFSCSQEKCQLTMCTKPASTL